MTDRPIEEVYIEALNAKVRQRGYTLEKVAEIVELSERQLRRVLRGESYSMNTLRRCLVRLNVKLEALNRADTARPPGTQSDANRRNCTQLDAEPRTLDTDRPVVGWRQAAIVVDVSHDTLQRDRRRYGSTLTRPWWESQAACREWYRALVAGPRLTDEVTPMDGGGE